VGGGEEGEKPCKEKIQGILHVEPCLVAVGYVPSAPVRRRVYRKRGALGRVDNNLPISGKVNNEPRTESC